MISARVGEQWNLDLDDLFVTIGHRFGRVELRRRMRDYVRGLLAPVARKNSWQLAEQAGHPTPDGLQHLLAGAKWNPDDIRDDLQEYVADKLGESDGVLIIDDTGFIKKGTTSAGVQRQYSGTAATPSDGQPRPHVPTRTAVPRPPAHRLPAAQSPHTTTPARPGQQNGSSQ
ncbi:transposase [Streptomyces sp. NPDC058623]|uniref:transposase n=1 Tax=Streptomyces sp. NPDC058623 TaxID=3346563 RepID=UPI00365F3AE9